MRPSTALERTSAGASARHVAHPATSAAAPSTNTARIAHPSCWEHRVVPHPGQRPPAAAERPPAAYFISEPTGTQALVNIAYPSEWTAAPLPHHSVQPTPRVPETLAGAVAPFALAAVLRDRLFTDVLTRFKG